MNHTNYQIWLDKTILKLQSKGEVPTLLMHSCCAPCSSYCLSYLAEFFKITIFYYNPNITNEKEYRKRVEEQKRLISALPVKHTVSFVEGRYEPEKFYAMAKGLERVPEGGERCFLCYEMRQRMAAEYAKEHSFTFFTTTLSVSPHKNAAKLNEIGERLETEYGISYLYSDFKKRGGYQKSIGFSKEYHLYRQNYCGCEFSKRESEKKRNCSRTEETMEEYWDVYDGNGCRTGRTMKRGTPVEGDYMLCVHVYLYTPDGKFLMQKRSVNKESHPGIWDVTGGAVQAGEKSIDAAIRETKEEVGISLEKSNLRFVGKIKKRKSFVDVYFAKKNFAKEDCTLQEEEVSEVCLVDRDEVLRIEREEREREPEYMALLRTAIGRIVDFD